MAPHRVSIDFDSENSSVVDGDFPKSSGSDDISNPMLSESDPIVIVGMGMSTLLTPGSYEHLLMYEKRMSSAWRCAISFEFLEASHGTAIRAV